MTMPNDNGIIDPQAQVVDVQDPKADPTPGSTDPIDKGRKEQDVADPAKKEQTPEENSAMRAMRLKLEALTAEKEQVKRDAFYAKKYADLDFTNEEEMRALYGDQGINSYEDLEAYFTLQAEAEKANMDVDFYKKFKDMETKLTALEQEKKSLEGEKLLESERARFAEEYGDFYKENEAEILDLAKRMDMVNPQGLQASVATVLSDKLPEILKAMKDNEQKLKDDAIKEFIEKKRGEIPTEGSGATPAVIGSPQSGQDRWKTATQSAMNALKGIT